MTGRLRTIASAAVLAIASAAPGCKKPSERAVARAAVDAGPAAAVLGAPTPLAPEAGDGAIGPAAPLRLLGVADDGGWVAICKDAEARPYLSVGAGPGLAVDRVLATATHDVLVSRAGAVVHVDAVARTERVLGPLAPAAVDDASRRVVVARGSDLVVFDRGAAPRTIATARAVSAVWLRTSRWAVIEHGAVRSARGVGCDTPSAFTGAPTETVDLDPGAEAVDRIGPELALTPQGQVTLDGEVVIGEECVPTVIAALASPPRVLAQCGGRDVVAGPAGFQQWVHITLGTTQHTQATIAERLTLGQRVVCNSGGCVDLLTGADFSTWQSPLVWHDDQLVVRAPPAGLAIDRLPPDATGAVAHLDVTLPRLTAAVTVDTVTGKRQTAGALAPPEFVDAAGTWLLYGRHVVDLAAGVVVTTLGADALAIDDRGRVLVPTAPSTGPLRWLTPRRP
ncbi:MAG: hypothetical protein IPL61_25920 [Myxococcales bacterium]|nr:hypothetical protein [Myxococcales bacterium]